MATKAVSSGEKGMNSTMEEDEYGKAVKQLMGGCDLLKVRQFRKYKRSFFLESSRERIFYRSPLGMGLWSGLTAKFIDLRAVREVRDGYGTDAFNRKEKSPDFCARYPAHFCFSFVMTDGKTVDLIARDQETRENWIRVTRKLVDQAQQSKREERLEKWLEKQFAAADISGDGYLNFEECLVLLAKVNLHISRDQAAGFYKAAGAVKLKHGAGDGLDSAGFRRFYSALSDRPELRDIFQHYASKWKTTWTLEDLYRFLVVEQKAREGKTAVGQDLAETCGWLVSTFEPLEENKAMNLLSLTGFQNMMMSSGQMLFDPKCQTVYQDMAQPLQHYFIASSHNTYLVDKQVMGTSSIEGYISTVLTGCRCLELDCWDGMDGEPMITHGFTLSSKMDFKHALTVLRDYGFKTSEYPLILSLENHCSIPQQLKMAQYLRDILGTRLFTASTEDTKRVHLPSPAELKGCVFLVVKKLPKGIVDDAEHYSVATEAAAGGKGKLGMGLLHKSPEVAKDLSDIVFLSEIQFRGFVVARDDGNSRSMDNIAEPKMRSLTQDSHREFIRHTQQHLVRIYPDGMRTDSSNMNPIPAMASGCQIVAFNYQSKSKETQVYRALFANNGGCGYLLKPHSMRVCPFGLDDSAETDKLLRLKVKVISAQQLPKVSGTTDRNITDPYVTVEIFGSDRDMNTFSTQPVQDNGFNPMWNDEFVFTLHDVDLAVLRFEVRDMDRRLRDVIGQYSISVGCTQEGYHHVPLMDAQEQPLDLTTLFVHIEKVNL